MNYANIYLKSMKNQLSYISLGVVIVVVFLVSFSFINSGALAAKDKSPEAQSYLQKLKENVETKNGEPLSGFNPAQQNQTSLASAASTPVGSGKRTDTPAKKVFEEHKHVDPSTVLPDTKKSGRLSSGCQLNLGGIPGTQCVTTSNRSAAKLFKKSDVNQ